MSRANQAARAVALVALLAIGFGLGACGRGGSAAERIVRAEQLSAAGKSEEAMIELRGALKAEPKSAAVNFAIAGLLHEQQQLPDAVVFYEEALRLDPAHVDAALALAFLMLGDDPSYSERLVDGVIARDPKIALAWVRRSDVALTRGDVDAALSAATTAAELEPDSARAQVQVGLVHRARVRKLKLLEQPVPDSLFEEALAAFDRAAAAKDDAQTPHIRVNARVERANTLAVWAARSSEAPAAYREAFEFAEKDGGGHDLVIDSAITYARAAKDAALRIWAVEQSVRLHPDRIDLWRHLATLSDPPDAESSPTLERMLDARATDARAHGAYARDLIRRGKAAAAIAHLDGVVAKVSKPELVLAQIVELGLDAGDEESAKAAGARLAKEYPASLEDYVAQAWLKRRAQDFRGAADSLAAGLDAFGWTAPLASELAEMRLFQGDTEASLVATERGLELAKKAPLRIGLLRLQARAHLARGNAAAAVQSFRKQNELSRGRVAIIDLVPFAQALYATNQPERARKLLDAALERPEPPLDAVILFARRAEAADLARAEALVTKALANAPNHPNLLEEAARLELASGRPEAAKERLLAAVSAAPEYAPLRITLGRVLLQTGDPNGAITHAEAALRLAPGSPDPLAAQVLVSAYAQLGKTGEAVKRLQAEHAAKKLGTGGRLLLARLLTAQGSTAPAAELLEGIVAEAPDLPGPKNDLAYLLVMQGKELDRALTLAQEARAAMPAVAGIADTLGFAYLAKDLPTAALPQFDEAIGLSEAGSAEWGLAQFHRALALEALERPEDATAAAEAALGAASFAEQKQAEALLVKLRNPS